MFTHIINKLYHLYNIIRIGKPNQNLFQPEVMAALRSRGGATWLRGLNSEHNLMGVDALDAGHGLYNAVKATGNIQRNYNEVFQNY